MFAQGQISHEKNYENEIAYKEELSKLGGSLAITYNVLYICVSAGIKTTMPNCLSRLVEPQNFKVCNLARIAQIYCYGAFQF